MIALEILFHVERDKRDEFLQLARSAVAAKRSAACRFRALFEDLEASGRYLWVERWEGVSHLEAYRHSDEHRAFMGGIRVLGRIEDMRVVELRPRVFHDAGFALLLHRPHYRRSASPVPRVAHDERTHNGTRSPSPIGRGDRVPYTCESVIPRRVCACS